MTRNRIVALIIGCLMLLPGIGALLAGTAVTAAFAVGRNDDGFLSTPRTTVQSSSAAVTSTTLALATDLRGSAWLTDFLDADIRLEVTPGTDTPVFLGVGRTADIDAYLAGASADEVTGVIDGVATLRRDAATPGVAVEDVTAPAAQPFWTTTAVGTGVQQLEWHATTGNWALVMMNADGSRGIAATAVVGVRAGFLLPLGLLLLGLGLLIAGGAIGLIVLGAAGRHRGGDRAGPAGPPLATTPTGSIASLDRPVILTASLDPGLSRWTWLVKWLLAVPHLVILAFLWPVFVILTAVAGICILFTGVYPRDLFEFNAGVLRWTWRVSYYAFHGGVGTDRYPPFTLGVAPDYPAALHIAYTPRLDRGLVLVKWWLLAIPHYLILGLILGNWFGWTLLGGDERFGLGPVGGFGILGLLVVAAGVVLSATGRYPLSLFDLILGMNRWIYRVVVYAALMTDRYPPFRLDQGGSEPWVPPSAPPAGPWEPRPLPEPAGSTTV